MRMTLAVAAALFCASLSSVGQSEVLVLAKFDTSPALAQESYLPGGPGDELTTLTYFQRSWDPIGPTGGWLANQFTAPDIATPPSPGPQGEGAWEERQRRPHAQCALWQRRRAGSRGRDRRRKPCRRREVRRHRGSG